MQQHEIYVLGFMSRIKKPMISGGETKGTEEYYQHQDAPMYLISPQAVFSCLFPRTQVGTLWQ